MSYTRQRIADHSDFSIKQINDNFSALFLKLSGNIDTIDLKNGCVTGSKIKENSITIGHLDSEFVKNFPLLDNSVFTSYAETLNVIDGNVQQNATLIQQNAEQISLHAVKLSGIDNDVSSLSVRADEIQSTVFTNREYLDNQIVRINDEISVINTTITDNHSSITQRADSIETNVSNLSTAVTENYSTLNGKLTSLTTTVTNNHSSINQRADSIETNVTSLATITNDLDTTVSSHSSQIRQLSDSISSKVSYTDYNGNEIVSLIEQTASNVKISANKIDLTGITRLYNPNNISSYVEFIGSSFSLNYDNNPVFYMHIDSIVGVDMYTSDNSPIRFYSPVYFENGVHGLSVAAKFA